MKKKSKNSSGKIRFKDYGLKAALKKVKWKLLIIVASLTIVLTSVYQLCMKFEFIPIMWIYYITLIVLSAVFLFMNRGVSRKPPELSALPSDWNDEKKAAYITDLTESKRRAKFLLIFIIPLLFNFLYETLYLFYLEPLFRSFAEYSLLH